MDRGHARHGHRIRRFAADVRRADRLKAALATGRMGEWSWDRRSGAVTWDASTATFRNRRRPVRRHVRGLDRARRRARQSNGSTLSGRRCRPARPVSLRPSLRVARWEHPLDRRYRRRDPRPRQRRGDRSVWPGDRCRRASSRDRGAQPIARSRRRNRERMEYLAKVNDVLAYSFDVGEIVQRSPNRLFRNSRNGARSSSPSTAAGTGRRSPSPTAIPRRSSGPSSYNTTIRTTRTPSGERPA